jgi:signal peptidase I
MSSDSRWRRWGRDTFAVAGFVAALFAARSSLADHYHVPSGSMEPTVEVGDRVLVNQAAYGLRVPFTDWVAVARGAPARGDVVVLRSPDEPGVILLKRVVGLPGDRIAVIDGKVWIDGAQVALGGAGAEPVELLGGVRHRVRVGPDRRFGPVEVPAGQFLVLGDNRGNSRDGRAFGFVDRGAILGRAMGVYWRHGGFDWQAL